MVSSKEKLRATPTVTPTSCKFSAPTNRATASKTPRLSRAALIAFNYFLTASVGGSLTSSGRKKLPTRLYRKSFSPKRSRIFQRQRGAHSTGDHLAHLNFFSGRSMRSISFVYFVMIGSGETEGGAAAVTAPGFRASWTSGGSLSARASNALTCHIC